MKKLLSFLFLIAQTICQAQQASYQLGHHSLKYSTGRRDLLMEMAAIGRSGFHSRVGGVSFEQVAVPSASLYNAAISLRYDSAAPDGSRLVVHVGNSSDSAYRMDIPDWELVPIAKYANQPYNAVVSLFGPDSTVQYNEAFKNTLLGMRMFQADLMFTGMDGLWDLIRDSIGGPIIAASEMKLMEPHVDSDAYDSIMYNLRRQISSSGSYILTDWGREVQFDVVGRNFYLTGEPYYLFTKQVLNPMSYLMHARVIVDSLRNNPAISDNPNFRYLARLLSEDRYYSWDADSVRWAMLYMAFDDSLTVDRSGQYIKEVQRLIDSCRDNDTLAYNDFLRDSVFKRLQGLCKREATTVIAEKARHLIEQLYRAREPYDHYCARIRAVLQHNPNPSKVLAANPRFRAIRRFAAHGIDSTDAPKIKRAIYDLGEKYLYVNDTATTFLILLDSIPALVDDSLLMELHGLEIRAPYPGLDNLYALRADSTICITTQLLLSQTEKIAQMSADLYTYNPAIYDAAAKVMHYAALFRFVRTHSPENWAGFMDAVKRVHVRASADTSTMASREVLLTPNHRPF